MMDGVPHISVVVPLWNKEREVARALHSVLDQQFADFEAIVIDDGSTDRGPDIVREIRDKRIRLVRQANQGVSAARNRGVSEARADVVAFLDADDEWRPAFLMEIQRLRRKYPSAQVYATNYVFCERDGQFVHPAIHGVPQHPWDGILDRYFAIACRSAPPLWSSAVAVSKRALDAIGGFPVGVTTGEDLVTWARLASRYQIAYVTCQAAVYWRSGLSLSCNPRYPDIPDVVHDLLYELLVCVPTQDVRSLRKYIAFWHRMRATSFLAWGRRRDAIAELRLAASVGGGRAEACDLLRHGTLAGQIRRRCRKRPKGARAECSGAHGESP